MGNTLTMQVRDSSQDLPEAAFYFTRRHAPLLYRSVEISTRAELHHFAPVLALILYEVDSLDDVNVVESGRDTEFCCEFLDIFLFCFVLPALSELLDGINLLFTAVPLVHKTDDRGGTFPDRHFLADTVLLEQARGTAGC